MIQLRWIQRDDVQQTLFLCFVPLADAPTISKCSARQTLLSRSASTHAFPAIATSAVGRFNAWRTIFGPRFITTPTPPGHRPCQRRFPRGKANLVLSSTVVGRQSGHLRPRLSHAQPQASP